LLTLAIYSQNTLLQSIKFRKRPIRTGDNKPDNVPCTSGVIKKSENC